MSTSRDRVEDTAPRWLVHLLRTTPAPIRWSQAGRAALALSVPIALGYVSTGLIADGSFRGLAYGALASTGALPSVTADAAGTYRYRALRLGGAVAAAVLGFGLGLLANGSTVASMSLVIVIAAVSALVSAAGSNASIAALQLFVFTVLGTGLPAEGLPSSVSLACFAAGACWGLLVALSGWTVRATTPERSAVAQVYLELAAMLSALATGDGQTSLAARHQLTRALNTAYDRLLTARSWLSGRDNTYRKLLNLLSASTSAIEASVAAVNEGVRPPRRVIGYFTELATAVLADAPLPRPPADRPTDPPAVAALFQALANINTEEQRLSRDRTTPLRRIGEWLSSLVSGPLTWTVALRVTLCVALAETARLVVPVERSYWITLTVGLIIKPDFGSVFGRAVLRGLGTVAGVGIGAAVLALAPPGAVLVLLIALFGAGTAIGKARSYGLLSAFVTPLIIVQMELSARGDRDVVLARLEDTVLGCAIVLIFGYLLWPGSRRPVLGGRLADVAETIARYAERGLRPAETGQQRLERSRRRRRAYRGLSDLRTAFQQVVVEPSAAGRQAVAWWPAIVALEQLTDAVTAVAVTIEQRAAPAPDEGEVQQVTAALAEFATAVRRHRRPADVPLPRGERLAGVTDRLAAAFDAVKGPDPSTFRLR